MISAPHFPFFSVEIPLASSAPPGNLWNHGVQMECRVLSLAIAMVALMRALSLDQTQLISETSFPSD